MAWRPSRYLIEGELDNTTLGTVTGWMQFTGMLFRVTVELEGDFHADIRGTKIHLTGSSRSDIDAAATFMDPFDLYQLGKVLNITAGRPPHDPSHAPHIEWFSRRNGRVVIELRPDQVQVIGQPMLASASTAAAPAHQKLPEAE